MCIMLMRVHAIICYYIVRAVSKVRELENLIAMKRNGSSEGISAHTKLDVAGCSPLGTTICSI